MAKLHFLHMLLLLALAISICVADKLEVLSFDGPYDSIDANGQRFINGTWIHGGSAEVKKNFIRLTSDRQDKKGYVWNSQLIGRDSFATVLTFRISGQGKKWFGDGIGLWLTSSQNYVFGDNHGFTSNFAGIGIIIDTFNNPDHKGGHKDVSVQINDGSKSLQTLNDETKVGCDAALRYHEESAAFSPAHSASRIKVKVIQQTLSIEVDEKSTGSWKQCYETTLPFNADWLRTATLGVTAATGGVADNHDVLRLVSFEDVNDKDIGEDDSVSLLQKMSKDYRKWLVEPSCHSDCRIAVLTKQIENFRIESDHALIDLKEKTSHTISKLRDQEQMNENRLEKIYQRIVSVVDNKVQDKITNTANQVKSKIDEKVKNVTIGGGWKLPFLVLFVVLAVASGVAYQKYQALRKSHLL
ncbi:hypothetical protein H257_17609 [Aphanomyces astaci]|uniref:L-type lectin-like domain-containing protein n=1 Tax=Aphanomyces astaci TaxID=112090 RepID=W4FG64_APHAT|nr:hypothetical protein H257_17609 [Aphanomyces astaci]ETV65723.1 hypothetical protein H257_17609 [Aphanomyces astaci]RHY02669.1 hypothetical protein DYB25_011537 [Aphanomyces astaci]RHY11735.1 hypothetical protein DYB36_003312 [Aphanomyces astaci]RHY46843.1 hypothetical protein DYB30_012152 [Aphanomyces astaci]RHY66474.1 hypothetical protein DYB34_009349 [Aphanomyces astaci]|eukprot:XP_009844775.1 hypothetical protein H257_17609 [Aphanomyces astaci]